MDVAIYEVNKTDLLQFGNQIGTQDQLTNFGGSPGGGKVWTTCQLSVQQPQPAAAVSSRILYRYSSRHDPQFDGVSK